jgi:uncharacterized protein YukE
MDEYDIRFSDAQAAYEELTQIVQRFEEDLESMKKTQTTLLSDDNWKGSKKTEFTENFNRYMTNAQRVLESAQNHQAALGKILEEYQSAENV